MNLQSHVASGGRIYKMYAGRLEKLGIITFSDFLFHLPSRYEDYSVVSKIAEVQIGETVTVQGTVVDIKNTYLRRGRIKSMQKALISDETGSMQLSWFNQPYLTKNITINSTISASGQVRRSGSKLSIVAPTFEVLFNTETNNIHTGRLIPVYPETQGITSKWIRRQVYNLIAEHNDELEEYLPEELLKRQHFMSLRVAIETIHFPPNLDRAEKARKRLAFEEFFLMQLGSLKRRAEWRQEAKSKPYKIPKKIIEEAITTLPFKLTGAQQRAIDDILDDFTKGKPMNRLVQGDVGSGKTVIAAIAMYTAHLNGYQSVLMAPTEILAQQHYKSIAKFLEPLGVQVELVTGSKKLAKNPDVIPAEAGIQGLTGSRIKSGMTKKYNLNILIGTHAVLSEKITFDNLGLVIIDEQQRFGVSQRGLIKQKGKNPHLLTMTATPIPRTVALTMYGDLDLSYLNEMPGGRKKIKTWVVAPEKRDAAYAWIRKEITETKSQAFIVCPFIEPSETMQTIKAVNHEYERLSKDVYPDLKLGLLHGRLKAKEKEDVLKRFRANEFDILVATPVVEVGIDIPNATIIMIEASERFGLAQLHQLRGRVGRGDKQSYCLLFTDSKQALTSRRLKGMETLYSGAELAELDLKLRGPGNLYGTAQHGVPKLKVASFADAELIHKAQNAAQQIFPDLSKYPLLEKKLEAVTTETVTPD